MIRVFVVEVEEKTRVQVEGLRQRQFGEIVIVNVVLVLIIDRSEKCVSKAAKFPGIE